MVIRFICPFDWAVHGVSRYSVCVAGCFSVTISWLGAIDGSTWWGWLKLKHNPKTDAPPGKRKRLLPQGHRTDTPAPPHPPPPLSILNWKKHWLFLACKPLGTIHHLCSCVSSSLLAATLGLVSFHDCLSQVPILIINASRWFCSPREHWLIQGSFSWHSYKHCFDMLFCASVHAFLLVTHLTGDLLDSKVSMRVQHCSIVSSPTAWDASIAW